MNADPSRYSTGEQPEVGDRIVPVTVADVGEYFTVRDVTWLATEFAVSDDMPPGIVEVFVHLDLGRYPASSMKLVRRADPA